jgi:hypothetical protein
MLTAGDGGLFLLTNHPGVPGPRIRGHQVAEILFGDWEGNARQQPAIRRPCPVTHIGALKCALIAYLDCDKLPESPSEKPTGCRCEPMANSDRPTIIEKYANRRLYNTGTYALVTLDDLAAMVKRRKDFLVYDAWTGANITRSVLAQIAFEQENSHGAR